MMNFEFTLPLIKIWALTRSDQILLEKIKNKKIEKALVIAATCQHRLYMISCTLTCLKVACKEMPPTTMSRRSCCVWEMRSFRSAVLCGCQCLTLIRACYCVLIKLDNLYQLYGPATMKCRRRSEVAVCWIFITLSKLWLQTLRGHPEKPYTH